MNSSRDLKSPAFHSSREAAWHEPIPRVALLRVAFLVGAITDGIAILPMLSISVGGLLWGVHDESGLYRFAMRYGASLMFGWTGLLIWAYKRPAERRFVAVLTMVVICGLALSEVFAVRSGVTTVWRMTPTWCLQVGLLLLFAKAYYLSTRVRGAR